MMIKVFAGNSNVELARKIVHILGISLGNVEISSMPEGETRVKILESVRGSDVYIIQSTCPPVNNNLMELLIMIDAIKRSSPSRITTVIPYYGYARQDRKHGPREPITAKLVADLISVSGTEKVLLMDLHCQQIRGFFDFPADNLDPDPLIVEYLSEKGLVGSNVTIVVANSGSTRRARIIARKVNSMIALVETRTQNDTKLFNVVGNLTENCVIIDDMIDTGKRVCVAAEVLKEAGAKRVYLWATHAVLSGNVELIQNSKLEEVAVTDTIKVPPEKKFSKLNIRPVSNVFAEAIRRLHNEEPLIEFF